MLNEMFCTYVQSSSQYLTLAEVELVRYVFLTNNS